MKKETLDKLGEYFLELVFGAGVCQSASPRDPTPRALQLYADLTADDTDEREETDEEG